MKSDRGKESQVFRLWIVNYTDWRPSQWNEVPPRARALEIVEDAVYSTREAAQFLEGFNRLMLENDASFWAVAVPVIVRYEGDVQPGMNVRGFVFPRELPDVNRSEEPMQAGQGSGLTTGTTASGPVQGIHFQGLDQSPQRSR